MFYFIALCRKEIACGYFEQQKVVYRIVYGNKEILQKEQSLYTKRAKSLWGEKKNKWPTFRITFPNNSNYYIFGIVVPNSFELDQDCLQELGFKLGILPELKDSISFRTFLLGFKPSKFYSYFAKFKFNRFYKKHTTFDRSAPFAEFRDWKSHRLTFVVPIGICTGLWVCPV